MFVNDLSLSFSVPWSSENCKVAVVVVTQLCPAWLLNEYYQGSVPKWSFRSPTSIKNRNWHVSYRLMWQQNLESSLSHLHTFISCWSEQCNKCIMFETVIFVLVSYRLKNHFC